MTGGGISWTTRALIEQARCAGARPARYNPKPAGQAHRGSATAAVLLLMRSAPSRRWRHAQLVHGTGRSASAIDWALHYLRQQRAIASNGGGITGRHWLYWIPEDAGA